MTPTTDEPAPPTRTPPEIRMIQQTDVLSEREAADLLNVAVSYLSRLLDEGTILSAYQDGHRIVWRADILKYRDWEYAERIKAISELTALSQELNMGY